jgi:hypothetical protein
MKARTDVPSSKVHGVNCTCDIMNRSLTITWDVTPYNLAERYTDRVSS